MTNLKKAIHQVMKEEKDKKDKPMPMTYVNQTPQNPPDLDKISVANEDMERSMSHLVDSMTDKADKPEFLTELNKQEIGVFALLESLTSQIKKYLPENEKADVLGMETYAYKTYVLRCSHKRKSRDEAVKIAKHLGNANQENRLGWLSKIREHF